MKRSPNALIGLLMLASWIAPVPTAAAGLEIELPPDTATLKPGPGVDAARAQCTACHSVDYIATQPRDKPLAFWKAEVEKMKKVYGAPIPDDQIDAIATYLERNYGPGK